MMYVIQTRQNRHGAWWCNATLNGYDYSFEGDTPTLAQTQMIRLLRQLNIPSFEATWEPIQNYIKDKELEKPQIKYQPSRIDNNPQG